MLKFQDLEEAVTRKKASNLLHTVLLVVCLTAMLSYYFVMPRLTTKKEAILCAVNNAGIGSWEWNVTNDSFKVDDKSREILQRDVNSLSEFVSLTPEREALIRALHSNVINTTCKITTISGDKFVHISGVKSLGDGIVSGILSISTK